MTAMQYGRTFKVRSDGTPQRALEMPDLGAEDADTWTVTVGTYQNKPPNVATNVVITYHIGEAAFTLPPLNVGANPTRILVTGRKIIVDIVPVAGDNVTTTLWSVGISRGGQLLGPEAGGSWISTPSNALIYNITAPPPNAAGALVPQGQVKVYKLSATVNNFNGAQSLYVMLMDNGTTPGSPGFQPIPGGRSSLVTPTNPSADFSGEFTPIVANTGLWIAISTTPDTYTAPAAGATFLADLFLGIQ